MLPERYRRLWRRRLRRRPLLPWLLVGTAAFDAAGCVAFYNDWEAALLYGVFLGQMCLLSVWGVSSRAGLLGRLLAIVCADWLIGTLLSPGIPIDISSSIAWCLGVTAAGTPVALLGTACHRLQAGFRDLPEGMSLVIHQRQPTITPRLWRGGRWNIATLLIVTSLVAVLTAVLGAADFAEVAEQLLEKEVRTLIFLTAAVVAGIAVAARQAIGRGAVCGVAVGIAVVASFMLNEPFNVYFGPSYFAGVTAISLAWLIGLRVRRRAMPSA